MEATLSTLNSALKSALGQLNKDHGDSLNADLHDTDRLPDKKLSALASESLDLLSEIRLLLEPAHLILADHFLGITFE